MISAWLLTFAPVVGASELEVLRIDGRNARGRLRDFSTNQGLVLETSMGEVSIGLHDILQIEAVRPITPDEPTPGSATFYLRGGGRLFGRVISAANEGARIKIASLGEVELTFKQLDAIRFMSEDFFGADRMFEETRKAADVGQDVTVMVRDEEVRTFKGVVESLSADGGTFRYRDRALPLNREVLYGIVFAKSAPIEDRGPMRIGLVTGESFDAELQAGDAAGIRVKTAFGSESQVRWDDISRVVFRNDRVVFLSDLEPAEYRFTPLFNIEWPYRMDQAVPGGPLQLGGRPYGKGIGMHSAATLFFPVPAGFRRIVGAVGIDDGARPRGNVVFRVTAEDRELFNSGPVGGTDPPKPFRVDLEGAKRVSLIVEFGEELDIADHADWANVRFVK